MMAATLPRKTSERTQMLEISGSGQIEHKRIEDITESLKFGDILVVNRSATMPSRIVGRLQRTGEPIEIRLAAFQGPGLNDMSDWLAISFAPGSWKLPTESRAHGPQLQVGDEIIFSRRLSAKIAHVVFDRLIQLHFESKNLVAEIFKVAKPIQYSYIDRELANWDHQSIFSGPAISVEPPSASLSISWAMIRKLEQKGIGIVPILHGAGISSTGDWYLDRRLPLREWFEVSASAAKEIRWAKANGRRVIAVGTSVLRALESSCIEGNIIARSGMTTKRIFSSDTITSVTSLITGMHDMGSSHMNIVNAFCPHHIVRRGYLQAEQRGYKDHEFGDLSFLDCGCG